MSVGAQTVFGQNCRVNFILGVVGDTGEPSSSTLHAANLLVTSSKTIYFIIFRYK